MWTSDIVKLYKGLVPKVSWIFFVKLVRCHIGKSCGIDSPRFAFSFVNTIVNDVLNQSAKRDRRFAKGSASITHSILNQ